MVSYLQISFATFHLPEKNKVIETEIAVVFTARNLQSHKTKANVCINKACLWHKSRIDEHNGSIRFLLHNLETTLRPHLLCKLEQGYNGASLQRALFLYRSQLPLKKKAQ